MAHVCVALTDATGVVYGLKCAELLCARGVNVTFLTTPGAGVVMAEELGLRCSSTDSAAATRDLTTFLESDDEVASRLRVVLPQAAYRELIEGASPVDAMLIAPCSMGCAAAVVAGLDGGLIVRLAGDVLRSRRRLTVLPTQTPLSSIDLVNLEHLALAGAVIVPASPSFTTRPASIDALVDTVATRAVETLGV